jgi:hypothetical protein
VLLAIDARGVDLAIQARADPAAGRQEPEEAAELRDGVLERGAALALPRLADERFHVRRGERDEPLRPQPVAEVREELRGRGDVLPDGDRGQAPQVVEHRAVDLRQRPDPRHDRGRHRDEGTRLQKLEEHADGPGGIGISVAIPLPARFEVRLPPRPARAQPVAAQVTVDPDQGTRLQPARASPIPLRR